MSAAIVSPDEVVRAPDFDRHRSPQLCPHISLKRETRVTVVFQEMTSTQKRKIRQPVATRALIIRHVNSTPLTLGSSCRGLGNLVLPPPEVGNSRGFVASFPVGNYQSLSAMAEASGLGAVSESDEAAGRRDWW